MTVVFITGGASGIGAALAREWRRRGATVVCADLVADPESGVIAVDVTDSERVRAAVDAVVAEHGRIDVMHNNAGISAAGPFIELTDRHWDKTIDVNLRGVIHGVQAVLPHMRSQRGGHIVNTASLNGLLVTPGNAPYVVTKHAVVALTTALRAEAALWDIRVTAICPSAIRTPILEGVNPGLPETSFDSVAKKMATTIPAMDPDEFARKVVAKLSRNPRLIAIPAWQVLPASWLQRFVPGILSRLLARQWRRTARGIGLT